MWEQCDLASMSPQERDWYEKILGVFPRGFSATYRDGRRVLVPPARLRVTGIEAGVPHLVIRDPFHSLEWNVLSTTENPDGSWTVETDRSGCLAWSPLTDEEHEEALASLRSIEEYLRIFASEQTAPGVAAKDRGEGKHRSLSETAKERHSR